MLRAIFNRGFNYDPTLNPSLREGLGRYAPRVRIRNFKRSVYSLFLACYVYIKLCYIQFFTTKIIDPLNLIICGWGGVGLRPSRR